MKFTGVWSIIIEFTVNSIPTKNYVVKYGLFRAKTLLCEIVTILVITCESEMWERAKYTPGIFAQRKTKMRVAPVTKWDLPTHDAKSYWYNVVKDLEAQVTKVRHQSSISFPPLSLAPPVKCSASDDDNVDYNLVDCNTQMRNVARELIVRVSPPSPSHNECVHDIASHDLRHVEHINYLKDCDIDNFQLDFSHEENPRSDAEKNDKREEKKIEQTKKNSKLYATIAGNNLPPLNKLTQLLKISTYVNEFLASARLKIGSTVVPRKFISPERTPNSHSNKRANHSFLDQEHKSLSKKNDSMKTQQLENIDRVEELHEENKESVELSEKHVGFQDMDVNSEEAECLRLRRTRAPSLGVASAVPSFGRILSSLEHSDSTESNSLKDNSSDDNRFNGYLQSPKDFLEVPRQKIGVLTELKNVPRIHDERAHVNSFNSHLKQGDVKSKASPMEISIVKNLKYRKKSEQWSKRSITHVIRALNRMKRREKVKTDSDIKFLIPITKTPSSCADYHSDSVPDTRDDDELATNTTNSSTSSNISDQDQFTNNCFNQREKLNSVSLTLNNIKNKRDNEPIETMIDFKDFDVVDSSSPIKENKSAMILSAMPQIGAMYSRKKSDKCLACLDTSMKIHSINQNKFSIWNKNVELMLSSESQNVSIDGLNNFHDKELSSDPDDTSTVKFASNNAYIDFQAGLFNENRFNDNTVPIPEMYPSKKAFGEDIVGKPTILSSSSDRKLDQSFEKKNIVSSKSFVSTLSLTSEYSKTLSDQDDSDQAIDEAGAMDRSTVETRSKFLAPCHAPLNLRPSLESLKALRGKTARSIKSRMASLEKTTDHSCDEESDGNEIPMTVNKLNDENKHKCSSPKHIDEYSDVSGDRTNIVDKLQNRDECSVVHEIFPTTSYARLVKATSILDNIYSQLNLNTNIWDYNPSDSFRPISPIISLSKIIEISRNALNDNNNVIKTLHMLANEHAKRVAEKNFMNSKSNVSHIITIMKITKHLLPLLVDSKLYFNPQYTSSHLEFSPKQKYTINSRQLRKVLPVKSYNLIAPILGLSQWHPKHWSAIKDARKLKTSTRTVTTLSNHQKVQGSISKSEFVTESDLIVHPPSQRGSDLSGASNRLHRMKRLNPYATFLIKPRRKAVVWRELTQRDLEGYDPEATLKNRAAKVTDKICSDFCQWMRSLGGFKTTINEDVLKNMFETDFTAEACKTMQVSINEMPMIPTAVATIRNCPEAGKAEIIRRLLHQDLRAEKKAMKLIGFGTSLPRHSKFVPPKNCIEDNWLQCENVPEDLETMGTVWKDITHLDSVKGFTQWLQLNSKVKPPEALRLVSKSKKGMRNA